ncbi:MAG: hypothetical protein MI923_11985 [Phycisphaerales bacterium]|nr:hypothetical protein [Phycisphaerales bacterium]
MQVSKLRCAVVFALICLTGCEKEPSDRPAPSGTKSSETNRVDISPTVRSNLGIKFVKVEARDVGRTIRAPGRFEPAPQARREYRAMLGGRVELHVAQYERIKPGTLLFTLDSPQWRQLQERLNDTESQLLQAKARLKSFGPLMAAHERHHDELKKAVEIWTERVQQLEQSRGSGVVTDEEFAQTRTLLANTRAELAKVLEREAELQSQKVKVESDRNAAHERFELLLMNAGSLLGAPTDELVAIDVSSGHARWREVRLVEVRASAPGVVESIGLTNGSWAAEISLVLTTVQPEIIRFRAMGLQSDLPKFSANASAYIVPPQTSGTDIGDGVHAALTIGLEAHPDERTITLVATPNERKPWMRAGVSAFLEVVVESSGGKMLAIPRSAVVKDGITHIFFRRDPADPNKAIRTEADMGVDDGRWVVIKSGLGLGDEVVLEGAYELKLATARSGTTQKGGHFHADGSFHGEH